ncbi:MAG: zinc ribbon domain-containing protein [Prevotella sp.]|nr:zinc ribbon domain-containing protein [Alistipes senegalensis]MCM1358609.1 zinc ribbon domain-containing protein [Prevotella sp.]
MICKNCGSELLDGAKFCSKCGSSQKPSDTASKQLNDYLEVLKHIKDSNNNSSSVDSEEVEEKVCTTIGGIILLIYIIGVGFSLKSVIIGSIIGYIIGWPISKVIGFLYKIISCSGNFVKEASAEYWEQKPVYIKVKQLQETACQKYMHMSIAAFEAEKINAGFVEDRRINDLLKLSEQNPTASLEQLIDIYYSGLFRQVIIESIFDISAEHTKFIRSLETENNKCPAEIMNRLHCCEDSLEKLIDDADDMSDLELLERVSEASDIFHALCKELEEIKNKEKLEAERRKKEAEQRRKDFPPAYYTDVHKANIKLYELKYNKFYQEQLKKFDPVRLATDALAKSLFSIF